MSGRGRSRVLAQPEPDAQVTVIWSPQPGPQAHAASCPVHELFYGGARGSGKSELLIGLWADHANKYGRYAQGILLRRRPVGMPSSTRSSATDPAGSSHRRRRRQRFRKVQHHQPDRLPGSLNGPIRRGTRVWRA